MRFLSAIAWDKNKMKKIQKRISLNNESVQLFCKYSEKKNTYDAFIRVKKKSSL